MKTINSIAEYEQYIRGSKPVLLEFFATWCPVCKALQPVLDDLSKDFENRVEFGKIDVEILKDLASQYEVKSIPAVFFIKNNKIIDQTKGTQSKSVLESKLTHLLALEDV